MTSYLAFNHREHVVGSLAETIQWAIQTSTTQSQPVRVARARAGEKFARLIIEVSKGAPYAIRSGRSIRVKEVRKLNG